MTTHPSGDCPDFPRLRGDYRCRHNPPTGQLVQVPFIGCRAVFDYRGELWLETLHDGVWFPSMCSGAWTVTDLEGHVIQVGKKYRLVEEIQT